MDNEVEDMYRSLPIADQVYLLVKGCYMKMRGAFIGTALVLGLFSFYLAFLIHHPYPPPPPPIGHLDAPPDSPQFVCSFIIHRQYPLRVTVGSGQIKSGGPQVHGYLPHPKAVPFARLRRRVTLTAALL